MKQLKLEVGKTYRSRDGKEVKIVGKMSWGAYPYNGSNDEWYAENGVFDYDAGESSFDLIAEVPETTRHTFTIPDGVKKVTVGQVGNRIVVEMVPVEDVPERERIMDFLQGYANNVTWNYEQLCWMIEDYLKQKEGGK